jgi:hypothetical protein
MSFSSIVLKYTIQGSASHAKRAGFPADFAEGFPADARKSKCTTESSGQALMFADLVLRESAWAQSV